MRAAIAGICGVVFGAGLAIAGMTDPAKVLAFLDVAGRWDPTLAFVIGGALAVNTVAAAVARRRERPWFAETFSIPTRKALDSRLVGGSILFGVGWGLVGLCPGPALANLWRGSSEIVLFVAAMLTGMILYRVSGLGRTFAPAGPAV